MLRPRFFTTSALFAALAFPAVAFPQQAVQQPNAAGQARQNEQPGQPRQGQVQRQLPAGQQATGQQRSTQAHAGGMKDGQFAACLIIDNEKEMALSELAAQQAQNEEVKQFAQRMIQEHQQLVQQLQDVAASGGYQMAQLTIRQQGQGDRIAQERDTRTPGATRDPNARPQAQSPEEATRRAARPDLEAGAAGRQQGADFITIKKEIAQECLKSAQQELSEKSGAEFDQCYILGQVMAHSAMADALKVFARHASPELQPILEKGQQTTQTHLAEAKRIAEQLDQGQGQQGQQERGQQQRSQQERQQQERERPNQ